MFVSLYLNLRAGHGQVLQAVEEDAVHGLVDGVGRLPVPLWECYVRTCKYNALTSFYPPELTPDIYPPAMTRPQWTS